ncbi:MAG: helix-turn-helix transcriptional regulator [Propioniciclava sp.]|uniref:helix-turn-helix domain-containing protein n=1 Tax=Propioniciclava sp. TaxID=2038686 RepID=UPI0039E5614C
MNTLEGLLGIEPRSREVQRAEALADSDCALLRALVAVRKKRGLSQQEVGEIMGVSQASVSQFEAHDSNPTLATIRRYAHAVGALVTHHVEADDVYGAC